MTKLVSIGSKKSSADFMRGQHAARRDFALAQYAARATTEMLLYGAAVNLYQHNLDRLEKLRDTALAESDRKLTRDLESLDAEEGAGSEEHF